MGDSPGPPIRGGKACVWWAGREGLLDIRQGRQEGGAGCLEQPFSTLHSHPRSLKKARMHRPHLDRLNENLWGWHLIIGLPLKAPR